MTLRDIPAVLQWIAATDEENAEQAREEFAAGLEGQLIYERGDRMVGTTGVEEIEGTDGSCWLGWTAVAPDTQPDEALAMLAELTAQLQQQEVRKIFAETSDPAEQGLRALLENSGFQKELEHPDYYAPGEHMVGLGLRLFSAEPEPIEGDPRPVQLIDLIEIEDADGTLFVDWDFANEAGPNELNDAARFARGRDGRLLFASAPSHATGAARAFEAAGFRHAGCWLDFHEDGVHEEHFRMEL